MSPQGCPFMNAVSSLPPKTPPTHGSAYKSNTTPAITFSQTANPAETPSILGFATPSPDFLSDQQKSNKERGERGDAKKTRSAHESITGACHYSDYLALTSLLQAQDGPSQTKPNGKGMMHHEENLFVIVHQSFELWFKMVLIDVEKCRDILVQIVESATPKKGTPDASPARSAAAAAPATDTMTSPLGQAGNLMEFNSNAASTAAKMTQLGGNLSFCLNYLRRIEMIITHATNTFQIIETMHCGDFLEFRDYLLPASGFQSVQFRKLEKELGVQDGPRAQVNGIEVFRYLKPDEQAALIETGRININVLINKVLATIAVPANFIDTWLSCAKRVMTDEQTIIAKGNASHPKIQKIIEGYSANLKSIIDDPVSWCEGLQFEGENADSEKESFRRSVIACLFVYQFRQEPKYAVLASVLEQLVAVEEALLVWRSRHLHMVERMIGCRTGTGGSSGISYLEMTRRYRIFHALWLVRKLTIRSSALPSLETLHTNLDMCVS